MILEIFRQTGSYIFFANNEANILTCIIFIQVLGNAKGAVAVVVSILIFRNPVTVVGMLGYGITVAGVVLYGEAKKRSK